MSDPLPPTEPLPSTPGPGSGAPAGPPPPSPAAAGRPAPGDPHGERPDEWRSRRRGPLVAALTVAVLLLVGSVGATVAWAHGSTVAQRGAVRTWDAMPGMPRHGWDRDDRPGQGARPGQGPRPGQGVQPGHRGGYGGRQGTGPGAQRGYGSRSGPSAPPSRLSAPTGPSPTPAPSR